MNTIVETLEDGKIKATVTVEAELVGAVTKRTYKDFAGKYNFPGFRKGKAPRKVIDNALGAATVLAQVAEDLVNDSYPRVIEAERIHPVGSPAFGEPGPVVDGQPFEFSFTVAVKPEVELSSYEPLEIELPMKGVTESEVEAQIESILDSFRDPDGDPIELTDEWVKEKMSFETVDALRDEIVRSIEGQKEQVLPRMKENACMAALIERFEGELSDDMAEEAEANLLQDFFTQLQQQGLSFDTYLSRQGITSDQFKTDVKLQAADEAKQQLALDAWARHEGIVATDEDVSAEFVRAGLPNPAATEQEWRETGRLYLIREGIVRAKAMEAVLESAKVTEVDYAAKAREEAAAKEAEAEAEVEVAAAEPETEPVIEAEPEVAEPAAEPAAAESESEE